MIPPMFSGGTRVHPKFGVIGSTGDENIEVQPHDV